jgi:orotate phosphoribosyltransferase-like protein
VGIHTRRPGEYVRPAGRLLIDDHYQASGEFYAAGAYYFQQSLSRFEAGRRVEAELVPEPHNPWDARAVAVDVEGRRVAYLPAASAKMWHDVVRAWNLAGFALYVRAETNRWPADGGEDRYGLTLPKWDWDTLLDLAEAAGLRAAWEAVLAGLTEEQRLALREDGGYTPGESVARALWQRHAEHPLFRWGGRRDGELTDRMPFWYGYFVREQMRQEGEEQRERRWFARSVKADLVHAVKAEIGRRREREREHARLRRQRLDERALQLQGEGLRVADIAARLGLTHKQAENALSRARAAAGIASRRTQDLVSERRRQAAQAVGLKRSGMARAQIAKAMGRSADTVDELVKDGLFYEAPEDHPERLELARRCVELRAGGLVKEDVLRKLGVSRKQALRAFRDASFVEAELGGAPSDPAV